MPDALCLRAQAQHFFKLAEAHSEGWEAPILKSMAAKCISKAEKVEHSNRAKPARSQQRKATSIG